MMMNRLFGLNRVVTVSTLYTEHKHPIQQKEIPFFHSVKWTKLDFQTSESSINGYVESTRNLER